MPVPVKCRTEINYHPDVLQMKQVMAAYFNGQLGDPDDDIVAAVLQAAGDRPVQEVFEYLRWKRENGHKPGWPGGPKTFGWILWAVKEMNRHGKTNDEGQGSRSAGEARGQKDGWQKIRKG